MRNSSSRRPTTTTKKKKTMNVVDDDVVKQSDEWISTRRIRFFLFRKTFIELANLFPMFLLLLNTPKVNSYESFEIAKAVDTEKLTASSSSSSTKSEAAVIQEQKPPRKRQRRRRQQEEHNKHGDDDDLRKDIYYSYSSQLHRFETITVNDTGSENESSPWSETSDSNNPIPAVHVSSSAAIRINCGGPSYTNTATGEEWVSDAGYAIVTSGVQHTKLSISNTKNQRTYKTSRYGPGRLVYEIPVSKKGDYEVFLHFAELYKEAPNERIFNVTLNGIVVLENLDVMAETGGQRIPLIKYYLMQNVVSGKIRIVLKGSVLNPILNGIEVLEQLQHFAHAVPGGPYEGVIRHKNSGTGIVVVDGTESHTHKVGDHFRSVKWLNSKNGNEIGYGLITSLSLPVGVHQITLRVEDSLSYDEVETTVTIRDFGYPIIDSYSPDLIDLRADESRSLTITGAGFMFSATETIVNIGTHALSGTAITVVNQTTIQIFNIPKARSTTGSVLLSVETPNGVTMGVDLLFVDVPIAFDFGIVTDFSNPYNKVTVIEFGPDGKLYAATVAGYIYKMTLDEQYNVIDVINSTAISQHDVPNNNGEVRSILGMAFNPNDPHPENPSVYVSNSILYHGWNGDPWLPQATNAKISTVSGAHLNTVQDVVTGLPVSGTDHSVNGIEFDNEGRLYIQVAANTNMGIPHSKLKNLEETYYSAATLVAHVNRNDFDGDITYDEDGFPNGGFDVELFAIGNRNPFSVMLHTNGILYGTDNGPNSNFGDMSTSCTSQAPGLTQRDKVNVLMKDHFYGHPNRVRARRDDDYRQCTWRNTYDPSDTGFTAPITRPRSSTNGIVEFKTEHFGGTLRGKIVMSRWKKELKILELSEDGMSAVDTQAISPEGGLDVTQGPDGTLFVSQYSEGRIIYLRPIESLQSIGIQLKSVFPWRGPSAGYTTVELHGEKFDQLTIAETIIRVGERRCWWVQRHSANKITCTNREGVGTVDVLVTDGYQTTRMKRAYTYVQ